MAIDGVKIIDSDQGYDIYERNLIFLQKNTLQDSEIMI